MRLKVSSPDKLIYEGFITSASVPTENGELKLYEDQTPIVSSLKPGILKFVTEDKKSEHIIISKGMMFSDGKKIRIVTNSAQVQSNLSEDQLLKNKMEIENKIKELKKIGSIENIEKYMIQLDEINSHLKLKHIKH